MRHLYIAFLLISIFFVACDNSENPVIQPSYLKIKAVETFTNDDEGSNKHLINDVWINVENIDYGVYPIPNKFPVLDEGNTLIIARGGIKNSNQSANRIPYPFFKLDSIYVDLVLDDTITINPEMHYRNDLTFPLIADFDNSNDFNLIAGEGIMQTTSNANEVFEGNKSLKIGLNEDNKSFAISTIQDFLLPAANTLIYLEMHYKNSSALNVSLLAYFPNENPREELVLKIGAKEEWSKIYIPITFQVSTLNASFYQLVFRGTLESDTTDATYYFDNIKIIHEPE